MEPVLGTSRPTSPGEGRAALSVREAVAFVVGVVIGAGIFKTPSLVAANVGSERSALLAWLLGGLVSLVGALCYAELASSYPDHGGDYHFIKRALGAVPASLFAWSRMTVIQTGSIAMQAYLIGDYASEVFSIGRRSAAAYAAIVVVLLTAVNVAGLRQSKRIQVALSAALVAGFVLVTAVGLTFVAPAAPAPADAPAGSPRFGLAMVFVLLTYGGWNEAAYLSADIGRGRRDMLRVLLWGLGVVTIVYLLGNLVFLRGLGLPAVAASEAVVADLLRMRFGEGGAKLVSVLVAVAALSTANATTVTGARSMYAFGRDFPLFRALGRWSEGAHAPVRALVVQGMLALLLVLLGALTRDGFATMVEYTAPVFWLFFLLVGISLFVLRRRDPTAERPFRVPLYPLTPLLFCAACAFMLRASLVHTGRGALVGVAALLSGVPIILLGRLVERRNSTKGEVRC